MEHAGKTPTINNLQAYAQAERGQVRAREQEGLSSEIEDDLGAMRAVRPPKIIRYNSNEFKEQEDTISPLNTTYAVKRMSSSRLEMSSLSDIASNTSSVASALPARNDSPAGLSLPETTFSDRSFHSMMLFDGISDNLETAYASIREFGSAHEVDSLLNIANKNSRHLSRFIYSFVKEQKYPLKMDPRNESAINALCSHNQTLKTLMAKLPNHELMDQSRSLGEHVSKLDTKIRELYCFLSGKLFVSMDELSATLKKAEASSISPGDLEIAVDDCERILELLDHLEDQEGVVLPSDGYFKKSLAKQFQGIYNIGLPKSPVTLKTAVKQLLNDAELRLGRKVKPQENRSNQQYNSPQVQLEARRIAMADQNFNEERFINNAYFLEPNSPDLRQPAEQEANQSDRSDCFGLQCLQS